MPAAQVDRLCIETGLSETWRDKLERLRREEAFAPPPSSLVFCLNFHCVFVFSDMAGDQLLIETEMAEVHHQGQAGAA